MPEPFEGTEDSFALSKTSKRRDLKNKKKEDVESEIYDNIKVPKSRKKKSKTKERTEEELKLEKQKESAKERARKSRDRKKHYTDELEEKVKILEKQVRYLTIELDRYRKSELKNEVSGSEISYNATKEQTVLEKLLVHLQTNTNVQSFSQAHKSMTGKTEKGEGNPLFVLDRALDVIVNFLIPENF